MFLKDLLPRYGIQTITALCHRLQLTKQYAWMLWHGKIGLSAEMIKRIHAELHVPLDQLLIIERKTPTKQRGRPRRQPPKTG